MQVRIDKNYSRAGAACGSIQNEMNGYNPMSQYTILRSCGHEEVIFVFAEGQASRLRGARNRPCYDCAKKNLARLLRAWHTAFGADEYTIPDVLAKICDDKAFEELSTALRAACAHKRNGAVTPATVGRYLRSNCWALSDGLYARSRRGQRGMLWQVVSADGSHPAHCAVAATPADTIENREESK